MRFGASESFLLYVTLSLEIILAVLVLRRRGFRSFPFFTVYVLLNTLQGFLLWAMYRWIGFNSLQTLYIAWSTQALLLIARGAMCGELCWQVLRKRPKCFWTLARDVLGLVGTWVVLYGAFDSARKIFHVPSYFLAIERGLELAIAVVLISLFGIALRYSIRIQRGPLLIAAGLCFYSLVQTVNNTFLDWLRGNFQWWNDFHIVAFQVALLLWICAFATCDFGSDDKPVPEVPTFYAEHAEEVHRTLHSLGKDFEEIVRK